MRTIDGVAEQRMADMGKVHPDLVGAPGLEPAGEQRSDRLAVGPGEGLPHLIMSDGLPPALPHRHLLPRMGMAVDRRIDRALDPAGRAPGESEVAAFHLAGP